jgi:hypothetical protein
MMITRVRREMSPGAACCGPEVGGTVTPADSAACFLRVLFNLRPAKPL